MATGRKRKVSYTKVTTRKKKKSPGQSSAAAAFQTDALVDLPSSSSEGKSLNSYDFTLSECWSYFCFTIKILLNTNLKEKKISRLLLHHPPFRCNPAYSASIQIFPRFWIWYYLLLISSGIAFTSNSQKIQSRFSTDTGTISELAHEHILYISDNHPSPCRPCTIWITWPAKHYNPELFIATPRSCWLQSRRNTPEAGKQPSSLLADPITLLFPSAILTFPSFQAQESPDNSLFSFQIGATSQEEGEEAT